MRRASQVLIPELLGRAPAMQQVFRTIGRLARTSVNVLITGEPGTGKELVARALHEHSPRAGKPFVVAQHLGDRGRVAGIRAVRARAGAVNGR